MTKPTITLLVVVTAIPSILMASQQMPSLGFILLISLGTALVSSSAAVFNQLLEKNSDQFMQRTAGRPLPSGKLSKSFAAAYGIILLLLGEVLLFLTSNLLTALLALAGHLFYVLVYTAFLKKKTPQNIVIGGAAGAVGPLIGWASVTGSLDWTAWILFLIITLWTPPHFWALALKYKDDYARAKIPMYPVVYGDEQTRHRIMIYTLILTLPVLALSFMGNAVIFYLPVSVLLSARFIWGAVGLYRSHDNKKAMPFFYFSCVYTFVLFGALAADRFFFLLRST
ncbi:MAG: heme o synthase [Oligoflexales bacterium]|nr:heme o synthase [Oligoflexales bacterium]